MNNQFKAFEDKNFEEFVTEENKKNSDEIFSVEYEGKKYWVKKGRKTSSNLFHHLCYKILPFEFLIPVESKTEAQSVAFESNKLIEFQKNGINVPEVIGATKNFFVMSDCGQQVYVYLRDKSVSLEQFDFYLETYINEVAKIHNANLYHGGAQSRNFTYKENKVFAIDLEDSFDVNVDVDTLQFRDLLLLLLSMSKVDTIEFEYKNIINSYIEKTGNKKVIEKLKLLSNKLQFLKKLNDITWIHNKLPRDAKEFCKLLDALYDL